MDKYLTSNYTDILSLEREKTNLTIRGIGDIFTTIKFAVDATIFNFEEKFEK